MPNDSPIPTSADIREFRNDQRRLYDDIYEIKLSVGKMASRMDSFESRQKAVEKLQEKKEDKAWEVIKMILPWAVLLLYLGFREWAELGVATFNSFPRN